MAVWRPLAERFYEKTCPEPNSGCLLWTAHLEPHGYGRVHLTGAGPKRASRVAWILAHGLVPCGMSVLHRCDVRACVNIAHLYLGTQRDNMRDVRHRRRAVGSHAHMFGMRNPRASITPEIAVHVLDLSHGGLNGKQIAARLGIGTSSVSRILNAYGRGGRRWRRRLP